MNVYNMLTNPVAFVIFLLRLFLPVFIGFLTFRRTKDQVDFFVGGRAMDKFVVAFSAQGIMHEEPRCSSLYKDS